MQWESEELKNREWALAKESLSPKGVLFPNGTKLRREDSGLSRSFLIVDGRILAMEGKNTFLGFGAQGRVKLAEDEMGSLYALKITKSKAARRSLSESLIAYDLGKSLRYTKRISKKGEKHYLPYFYLGTPLDKYLKNNKTVLTDDQRYDLAIKITLACYKLHSGQSSKTGSKYSHGDVHLGNMLINEITGEISLIDFGWTEPVDRFKWVHRNLNKLHRFFINTEQYTPQEQQDGSELEEILLWPTGDDESVFIRNTQDNNVPKSLETLLSHHSTKGYQPTERSLLDVARKLTFIRFKLDNLPFYNQQFSVSSTEEIMKKLNEQAENINIVYCSIENLRLAVNESVEQDQIIKHILDLENSYKLFLIGYTKNEYKEEHDQFLNCLKIIEQQLSEHLPSVERTKLTSIESAFDKLLLDSTTENILKY